MTALLNVPCITRDLLDNESVAERGNTARPVPRAVLRTRRALYLEQWDDLETTAAARPGWRSLPGCRSHSLLSPGKAGLGLENI